MNYYQILGIKPDATNDCIRRAFRSHAKRIHPDVNPDISANQEFQLMNEAYQVLRDTNKRRLYDIRLANGVFNRRVYYRPGQTRPQQYARYKYRDVDPEPSNGRLEKILDQFLFFSMLALGLSALFSGLYRTFGEPVEGVNPVLGIVFGVVFTSLLVFVWDKRQRLKTGR